MTTVFSGDPVFVSARIFLEIKEAKENSIVRRLRGKERLRLG